MEFRYDDVIIEKVDSRYCYITYVGKKEELRIVEVLYEDATELLRPVHVICIPKGYKLKVLLNYENAESFYRKARLCKNLHVDKHDYSIAPVKVSQRWFMFTENRYIHECTNYTLERISDREIAINQYYKEHSFGDATGVKKLVINLNGMIDGYDINDNSTEYLIDLKVDETGDEVLVLHMVRYE